MKNIKNFIAVFTICAILPIVAHAEVWYVKEVGDPTTIYHDVWTKKSGEKPGPVYYTAVRDETGETYDLTMYWSGNKKLFAERRNDSFGAQCDYDGVLTGSNYVSGNLYCDNPKGGKIKNSQFIRTWTAQITW